jgi:nucleoside-diphosphate-sugar epimerase
MAHLVAVTGGSGYIASELIKQLLEKGYNVRATVRDKNKLDAVGHLIKLGEALPGERSPRGPAAAAAAAETRRLYTQRASSRFRRSRPHSITTHSNPHCTNLLCSRAGRLELVEADLLHPGSFDAAFRGAAFVFHTASPFFIDAADPQAELVDVAVAGTRNVMAAAAAAGPALRRVVLTSSCAALKGMRPAPPVRGAAYTEEDWNETSTVAGGEAYWVGKAQAERAAWAAAAQHGLDLVTILPEFVMGPVLSPRAGGTSVGYMRRWVQGGAHAGAPVFADVRDVARAHVLAAEVPEASGRYIVAAEEGTPPQQVAAWLSARFPDAAFAEPAAEGAGGGAGVDSSRARRELGLALTPVRSTIEDMAVTMVQLGLATPRAKGAAA